MLLVKLSFPLGLFGYQTGDRSGPIVGAPVMWKLWNQFFDFSCFNLLDEEAFQMFWLKNWQRSVPCWKCVIDLSWWVTFDASPRTLNDSRQVVTQRKFLRSCRKSKLGKTINQVKSTTFLIHRLIHQMKLKATIWLHELVWLFWDEKITRQEVKFKHLLY